MLGYVVGTGAGTADALLVTVANRLAAHGLRLAGAVQHNSPAADGCACDMDLAVLAPGQVVRISQTLGRNASGCRLDADGLERAVALVEAALTSAPQLLILNKFGQQEAMGRGFYTTIGRALEAGIPVLLAVNQKKLPAFLAFAGDLATALPADADALCAWALAQTNPAPVA